MKQRIKRLCGIAIPVTFLFTLIAGFFAGTGFMGKESLQEGGMPEAVTPEEPVMQPALLQEQVEDYRFLSDLDWVTTDNVSYANGGIKRDKNYNNGTIQLLTEEGVQSFSKGLSAHAKSQVDFDLTDLPDAYTRFSARIGIDHSQFGQSGNGVIFQVFAGSNASTLECKYNAEEKAIGQSDVSVLIDVDITGCDYLRLYADPNGEGGQSNWFDHAIWANARLLTADYQVENDAFTVVKPLSDYNETLLAHSPEDNYAQRSDLILEREAVKRLGYQTIQNAAFLSPSTREALTWLFTDKEALRLFIEAGTFDRPNSFINGLSMLYRAHSACLTDPEDGLVYKKMLLALAVAYSGRRVPSPFANLQHQPYTNALAERFTQMKKLYDEDKFLRKEEFRSYHMELMRFIFTDAISNEEIPWLRAYAERRFPTDLAKRFNPNMYMGYKSPNYDHGWLYSEDNRELYTKKYYLDEYNIPYGLQDGKKVKRTWMVIEAGGICWNISRLGQEIYKVHGISSIGIFQPGHEAFLYYEQQGNDPTTGRWNIGYDLAGWANSYTDWDGIRYRLLLGWGCQSYNSQGRGGKNASYQLLGQAAINRYSEWQKSICYNFLADVYSGDSDKERVYNLALDGLDINLDSYYNLIQIYNRQNRTSEEWYALAQRIATAYTYYPKPMADLLDMIRPHLNGADQLRLDLLRRTTLTTASKCTDEDSLQRNAVREVANSLLSAEPLIATFSFDGENAGQLVFDSRYNAAAFAIEYSIDGFQTSQRVQFGAGETAKKLDLRSRVDEINPEHDIRFKVEGYDEIFLFSVTQGTAPTGLVVNDLENRFVGTVNGLEYSTDSGRTWYLYDDTTRFAGDVSVILRKKASGTVQSSPASEPYLFTAEGEGDVTKEYIPISAISSVQVSTEEHSKNGDFRGILAVDGNDATWWHTRWNYHDEQRYIIVEFDTPRILSQIGYLPNDRNSNGRLRDVDVYVGMNGTDDWKRVGGAEGLPDDATYKTISLLPTAGRYIKIVGTHTYGDTGREDYFMSAKRFDFYEDRRELPVPEAVFSTQSPTNGAVSISLDLPEGFTLPEGEPANIIAEHNGEYQLRYLDSLLREQVVTVLVSWIDTVAPTAEIAYEVLEDGSVVASVVNASETISFGEDGGRHHFTANGTYTFVITDAAGNTAELVAEVRSIAPPVQEEGNPDNNATVGEDGLVPNGTPDPVSGRGDTPTMIVVLASVGAVLVVIALVTILLVRRRKHK